jgi:hypothetical protein
LPRVASIVLPQAHRENGLRCWLPAFSLVTENLPVLLSPRSRNRGLHWYLIPTPGWLRSKAWLRSGCVWHRARVHLHPGRRDVHATHPLSTEVLNARARVSVQALSSPRKEVQPSNGELPLFFLLQAFISRLTKPAHRRRNCAGCLLWQPVGDVDIRLDDPGQVGRHVMVHEIQRLLVGAEAGLAG